MYKILDVDFFPNEKNQHLKFYTGLRDWLKKKKKMNYKPKSCFY